MISRLTAILSPFDSNSEIQISSTIFGHSTLIDMTDTHLTGSILNSTLI